MNGGYLATLSGPTGPGSMGSCSTRSELCSWPNTQSAAGLTPVGSPWETAVPPSSGVLCPGGQGAGAPEPGLGVGERGESRSLEDTRAWNRSSRENWSSLQNAKSGPTTERWAAGSGSGSGSTPGPPPGCLRPGTRCPGGGSVTEHPGALGGPPGGRRGAGSARLSDRLYCDKHKEDLSDEWFPMGAAGCEWSSGAAPGGGRQLCSRRSQVHSGVTDGRERPGACRGRGLPWRECTSGLPCCSEAQRCISTAAAWP